MSSFLIEEKRKVLAILHHLISKRVEIFVKIEDSDEQFSTRVVKLKRDGGDNLIIEKLYPESGNLLIQSYPDVVFSFELSESECVFATKYIGINTEYPEFGLIVDFPSTAEIEDKRGEERIENGLMEFLSVELSLEGDTKSYNLKAINLGASGIGLIIDKENLDLLEKVNVGDTVKGLRCFLPQATLTIDGTVRHKTRIAHGGLEGSYIMGIESDSIMDLEELKESLKKKT